MINIDKPFKIAEINIYPQTDEISLDGVTIEIKSMAMKLICYFAVHPEQVISRDALRQDLWKNAKASDHTINNHIYSLRQIFTQLDNKTKYLHTVTGSQSGYRLLAKVSQTLDEEATNQAKHTKPTINHVQVENTDPHLTHLVKHKSPIPRVSYFSTLSKTTLVALSSIILVALITLIFLPEPSYNSLSPLTSMQGREQNPSISQDGAIVLYANRSNRESTWELYASRLSDSAKSLTSKKVFQADRNNDNYVSISPNKKLIAFIRYPKNKRGIYLADFDENTLSATNERLAIPLNDMNLSPAISWLTDTQFFYTATEAISAPRKIFSYDLQRQKSKRITAPPLNTYGDFAVVVSPDKHWLAIMRADASYGYELYLYDLHKKALLPTPVTNSEERLNISFDDNSNNVFFINQQGYLSSYNIYDQVVKNISTLKHPGYFPLKIPGKNQFIAQQDWGLSSLTNRVIKISNPLMGGDATNEVVIDNGLSIRSITSIANNGLIFASIKANQKIELWKYTQEKTIKLAEFNNTPSYKSTLSLDWLKGSDKALLSINNTCFIIDLNTGQDSPLCPDNHVLYAGKFSKDGQSIYLAGDENNKPQAVEMGISGYPLKPLETMRSANAIQQGDTDNFYYSESNSYDIYQYNAKTGKKSKLIDRSYVIERFSNNDFVVVDNGIYFMDRKEIKKNAIYFYRFKDKKLSYVIPSKDNYPHFVLSDDEKFIYLIQSYDNNSHLTLITQ
jgi:DNA-binding winged helix-turn-helix (wHTH) protein